MPLNLRPFPRDYLAIGMTIEARSAVERETLAEKLRSGAMDLSPAGVSGDPQSGLFMLGAASERELEAAVEAVRQAGIAINTGAPQVDYREILSAPVEADYTHQKQSGTTNQFAKVSMRFEPSSRSMSNVFVNDVDGSAVPDHFLPGIEQGFRAACHSGPLGGFPIVACRATLIDGAYHGTDSSPLAFEIATRAAFREAVPATAVKLLEPYLEVDITTPDEFVGSVIGDFRSRRGVNTLKEASPGVAAIYGFAPLANMFGYEANLASITRGQATYAWKLAGLEEVPTRDGPDTFSPAAAKRG